METNKLNVSIIGTAGRHDLDRLHNRLYETMIHKADMIISGERKGRYVHLISGGAAWSDHIAVSLFLRYPERYGQLTLHLPCPLVFDTKKYQFEDTGSKDFRQNPGRSANMYHAPFSKALGRDTLEEIHIVEAIGARLVVHKGFFARNTEVAKCCDMLLAFTWNEGDSPSEGGTLDTWNKCTVRKKHISLQHLAE